METTTTKLVIRKMNIDLTVPCVPLGDELDRQVGVCLSAIYENVGVH